MGSKEFNFKSGKILKYQKIIFKTAHTYVVRDASNRVFIVNKVNLRKDS